MIIRRSTEVATVTATLDRAASGLSAIVVEGEAGIGKTTLVDNAARGARERSFAVMACRPAQSEASLSFGAPADLVAGVEEHELRRLPGPQRRALDAVRLHADPDGDDLQPRAVGIALRSALEGLSARTPVLVAVDDAQWLDQPLEQALRFALRRGAARWRSWRPSGPVPAQAIRSGSTRPCPVAPNG